MSAAAAPATHPLDSAGLLRNAIEDVTRRPWPHIVAQVGLVVPAAVWMVVSQVVATAAVGVVMLTAVVSVFAAAAADQALHHRDGALTGLAFFTSAFVGEFGFMALVAALVGATVSVVVMARFGLHRDLARQDEGGPPMGFASSFRQPFWRLGTALVAGLIAPLVLLSGPLGVPVAVALAFHVPTMAIRDVGCRGAVRLQVRAFRRDPGRFVRLAGLSALVTILGVGVPLVNTVALAFQHRAAREVLAGV